MKEAVRMPYNDTYDVVVSYSKPDEKKPRARCDTEMLLVRIGGSKTIQRVHWWQPDYLMVFTRLRLKHPEFARRWWEIDSQLYRYRAEGYAEVARMRLRDLENQLSIGYRITIPNWLRAAAAHRRATNL